MNLTDELQRLNEESKARKLEHDEYVYLLSTCGETKGLLKEAEEMNRYDSQKINSLRAEVVEMSVNCCIEESSLARYKDAVLLQAIEINEKKCTLKMLQMKYGNDIEEFIASSANSQLTKQLASKSESFESDLKVEKGIAYLEGEIAALQLYMEAVKRGLHELRALLDC